MTFFDVRQIYAHLDRIHRHITGSSDRHHSHDLKLIWRILMALDTNVQALIDAVANNSSLVASVIAGLKIESDQIAALQAQIAAMTPGQPVDAEDLAAVQKAVTDLQATNAQLQTAVPASTPGV